MREFLRDWRTVVDRRGRFTFAVGLLIAFAVSVLEIVGAGVVAAAIELAMGDADASVTLPMIGDVGARLPGSDRSSDLRWLALLGSLFFVCRGLAVVGQQYFIFRSSYGLAVRLTDRVLETYLGRDYPWHLRQNSAELSSVATGVCQSFAIRVFTPMLFAGAYGITILALGAVALSVEPVGGLVTLLVLCVGVGGMLSWARRRLLPLSQIELEEMAQGQQLTTEIFQGVREVKLMDLSIAFRRRIWESRRRWGHAMRQGAVIVALPRTLIETIAFTALIVLVAVRGGSDSGAALASLGVLGYAVVRILPTANNVVTHINSVRSGQASLHRLAQVLSEPAAAAGARAEADRPASLPLTVRGLRFGYTAGRPVLGGVDLRVEHGQSIGLVGSTGCGKSTLLDVLVGLLEPTGGSVELDGVPLSQCRKRWWNSIGFVPQSITLFDASLAENIAMAVDPSQLDHAALDRAIDVAELREVVDGLDEGIMTPVGERGVRLSGGQRQRVAIARALYRDPEILFIDEGTSALDSETERKVIRNLREGHVERTIIMVAHRTSTLRDCDEILLLDRGVVIARGTHDELWESSPAFRALARP